MQLATCKHCGIEFQRNPNSKPVRIYCTRSCKEKFYHNQKLNKPEYKEYKRGIAHRYYLKEKERLSQRVKIYRAENPEKVRSWRKDLKERKTGG